MAAAAMAAPPVAAPVIVVVAVSVVVFVVVVIVVVSEKVLLIVFPLACSREMPVADWLGNNDKPENDSGVDDGSSSNLAEVLAITWRISRFGNGGNGGNGIILVGANTCMSGICVSIIDRYW